MTAPAVVFPDVAALTITFLRAELVAHGDDAEVHQRVPDPRPARFVTIVRGGGPRDSLVVDRPTIFVEAWAQTDADAHDLAQLARALIHTMTGAAHDGIAVYRIDEFSGPATLPDPDSGQPRATFTLSLRVRGAALTAGS